MKSIILAAALGLSGMTFASAKTYNMVLSQPATAANVQLAAGRYMLNVQGHIATFTNTATNKSVMVQVRLDNASAAYEHTAVELKKVDGSQQIESIELEDSTNKLEF
jgi:hypothetical protein